MDAATIDEKIPVQKDPTKLYATLQRLQEVR